MRGYLILICGLGLISAILGHGPSGHDRSTQVDNAFADYAHDQADDRSSSQGTEVVSSDGSSIDVPRSSDGHFYADVDVNGTKLHMLIDTGASGVALSRDDARSAGIATSIGMNDVVGEGADGSIHGEYVQVDRMALGNKTAEDVPAVILNRGTQSLLGQSFLAKFASVEIHGDTMTLR
jgi:aspartyl protease family protein